MVDLEELGLVLGVRCLNLRIVNKCEEWVEGCVCVCVCGDRAAQRRRFGKRPKQMVWIHRRPRSDHQKNWHIFSSCDSGLAFSLFNIFYVVVCVCVHLWVVVWLSVVKICSVLLPRQSER